MACIDGCCVCVLRFCALFPLVQRQRSLSARSFRSRWSIQCRFVSHLQYYFVCVCVCCLVAPRAFFLLLSLSTCLARVRARHTHIFSLQKHSIASIYIWIANYMFLVASHMKTNCVGALSVFSRLLFPFVVDVSARCAGGKAVFFPSGTRDNKSRVPLYSLSKTRATASKCKGKMVFHRIFVVENVWMCLRCIECVR